MGRIHDSFTSYLLRKLIELLNRALIYALMEQLEQRGTRLYNRHCSTVFVCFTARNVNNQVKLDLAVEYSISLAASNFNSKFVGLNYLNGGLYN